MPKIKTHKATAKRSKRKRSRMANVTNSGDITRVNKLAPYLKKK